MGLLDQVAGAIGGQMGLQQMGGNPLLNAVLKMITNPRMGGMSGLLGAFRQGGLGTEADSWVSTGRNIPISADQLRNALGGDRVRYFASETGLNDDEASEQLSQVLPQVVDKLTPDGYPPEDNDLAGQDVGSLMGRLFR